MYKSSSIGRIDCPHCGKNVPVTATKRFWYHIPLQDMNIYVQRDNSEPIVQEATNFSV